MLRLILFIHSSIFMSVFSVTAQQLHIIKSDTSVLDHSEMVQKVFNSASNYDVIRFEPGTYRINEIVIPDVSNLKVEGKGAVLAASRDCEFLISSAAYADDFSFPGKPLSISGLIITGSSYTVAKAVVLKNWNSEIKDCEIKNVELGVEFTTVSRGGTDIASGKTMVNNKILNNKIIARNGIRISDPSRNKATDYFISNNLIYHNEGGNVGIYLQASSGGLIQGNHTYSMRSWDLYIDISSVGLRVVDNYFEGANKRSIKIGDFISGETLLLSGNVINSRVQVYDAQGNYSAAINSNGNVFREDGHIFSQWTKLMVLSTADSFQTPYPFRSHNANSPVKVMANNSFYISKSGSTEPVILTGIQGIYDKNQTEY